MAIRTYTVTVSNPGSGNKYFIDGVQQDTVNLAEGYTYVFNYPSGHPFKFSTTSDGTHSGGAEYTTGVTHDSSTQVTIVVASGAPQLYYYCSLHSGMGGTANTVDPSTWGVLTWGQNAWSDQSTVTISLTGVSATTSIGSVTAYNATGWGRDTWGFENWGESSLNVSLTGVSATTTLGTLNAFVQPGWGTLNWGENGWGSVDEAVYRIPDGVSATSSVGAITPADVMGLTGVSATSSVGAPTIVGDVTVCFNRSFSNYGRWFIKY